MQAAWAEAAVWLVDGAAIGEAQLAGLVPWLSESEAARHARFVRPERRRQFVIGRALLRRMLGHWFRGDPRSFVLEERPGQAPLLLGSREAYFSISHSGPWVACALTAHTPLGLDIERIDPGRDWRALAAQAFPRGAAPADTRSFYEMWTEQEARIKLGRDGHCTRLDEAGLAIALCSALPVRQGVCLRHFSGFASG